jgi:Tfp pilus assembly protein PilN
MIKINLAPPRQRKSLALSVTGPSLGLLFGVLSLVSILGIGGYWWTLTAEAARLERDIAAMTARLAQLKEAIAEGNRHRAERDDLEKRLIAVEELSRGQTRSLHFLDRLAGTIPADLWLSAAAERDGLFRISGTAFSANAVADFMTNLEAAGPFKDVELVIARQDISKSPRTITFEVTCRFESPE